MTGTEIEYMESVVGCFLEAFLPVIPPVRGRERCRRREALAIGKPTPSQHTPVMGGSRAKLAAGRCGD